MHNKGERKNSVGTDRVILNQNVNSGQINREKEEGERETHRHCLFLFFFFFFFFFFWGGGVLKILSA